MLWRTFRYRVEKLPAELAAQVAIAAELVPPAPTPSDAADVSTAPPQRPAADMQPCANCQRNVANALSAKRAHRELEGKLGTANQREKALAAKLEELDKVRRDLPLQRFARRFDQHRLLGRSTLVLCMRERPKAPSGLCCLRALRCADERTDEANELTAAAIMQALQAAQEESAAAQAEATASKQRAAATQSELTAAQTDLTQKATELEAETTARAELSTKLAAESEALAARTAERDELAARAEREEATTRKLQQATEGLEKSNEEQRRGNEAMLTLAQKRLSDERARTAQLQQEKADALEAADSLRREFTARDREVRSGSDCACGSGGACRAG